MALQNIRSNTASKRPLASGLSDGQIAVNTNETSPGLFFKGADGAVLKVGPVHIGNSAPNSSPATGGSTGNSVGEQWLDTSNSGFVFKIWDGTAWRSETGEFVDVTGDTMTGNLTISNADLVMDNGEIIAAVNLSFRTGGITNSEERLRITSDGKVGIGTTDPFTFLHVKDNTPGSKGNAPSSSGTTDPTTVSRIASRASVAVDVGVLDSGTSYIQNRNQGDFSTNYNFVINPNGGNVGIGTTAPSEALNVQGNILATGRVRAKDGSLGDVGLGFGDDHNVGLYRPQSDTLGFVTTSSERVRIDSSGRLLVGTSSAAFIGQGIIPTIQVENTSEGTSAIGVKNNQNNAGGSRVMLAKSRGTAVGSSTIVNNGDTLGQVAFAGADGTDTQSIAASILAAVDGTPGANDMPGRLVFSTTADGASTPTERMRIDSDGKVGIGTSSPANALQVEGDVSIGTVGGSGPYSIFWAPTTGGQVVRWLTNAGGNFSIGRGTTVGNNEEMRIDTAGNILVAQTTIATPGAANTTLGLCLNANGTIFASRFDSASAQFNVNADASVVVLRRSGVQVGSISVTTTATAYNTSSDYRLKENVVPLNGAADRVNQLQVHRFNFIADPDTTVDGFLAHEAQAVVPECVTGTKDEVDDEGNPVYQGIDQSKMVPLAVAAIQECIKRIEALETELALLKSGN